jgi:hypothetical protein
MTENSVAKIVPSFNASQLEPNNPVQANGSGQSAQE